MSGAPFPVPTASARIHSSDTPSLDEIFGEVETIAEQLLPSKRPDTLRLFLELLDQNSRSLSSEGRAELGERLLTLKVLNPERLAAYAGSLESGGKKILDADPELAYDCLSLSHALKGEPIAVVTDVKETLAIYSGGKPRIFDNAKPAIYQCAAVGPLFFLSGDSTDSLISHFTPHMGFFGDDLIPNAEVGRDILENIHLLPHTGATIIYLRSGDEKYRVEKLLGGFSNQDRDILEGILREAHIKFDLKTKYDWIDTNDDQGAGYYHFDEVLPGHHIGDFYPLGVMKQHMRPKFEAGGEHAAIIDEIIQIFDWCNKRLEDRGVTSGKLRKGGLSTGDCRSGTKGDGIELLRRDFLPSNAVVTAIDDRIEKDGNGEDMTQGANYAIHVGDPGATPPAQDFSAIRIVSSAMGKDGGAAPYLFSSARANRLFQILSPESGSIASGSFSAL